MSEQTWTPPGEAQIAEVDAFLTAYDFMIVDPRFVNAVDLITAYRRALPILRDVAEAQRLWVGGYCSFCGEDARDNSIQHASFCPVLLAAPWRDA